MIRRGDKMYRCVRQGGRPRVVYAGLAGSLRAQLAEDREALDQQLRADRQARRRLEAAQHRERDRGVAGLVRAAGQAAALLLTAGGYGQHKREWRPRTMSNPVLPPGVTAEALSAAYQQARAGDREALAFLTGLPGFKSGHPALLEVLGGSPEHALRRHLVGLACGDGQPGNAAGARRAERLAEDLAQEGDTPLHGLAVEAVVAAWLHHHANALRWAAAVKAGDGCGISAWEKRSELSSRRLARAVALLARLRHLLGGAPGMLNLATGNGTVIAQQIAAAPRRRVGSRNKHPAG